MEEARFTKEPVCIFSKLIDCLPPQNELIIMSVLSYFQNAQLKLFGECGEGRKICQAVEQMNCILFPCRYEISPIVLKFYHKNDLAGDNYPYMVFYVF